MQNVSRAFLKLNYMKVTYEELLPTNPYLNARIGLDHTVENEEEVKPMLHKLKKLVNEWHKEAFPHMYIDDVPDKTYFDRPTEELTPNMQEKHTIKEIEACTELAGDKGLESFQFLTKLNPKIMAAYHKKLKELTIN
jgi:hypothetical protein